MRAYNFAITRERTTNTDAFSDFLEIWDARVPASKWGFSEPDTFDDDEIKYWTHVIEGFSADYDSATGSRSGI